MNYEEFDSYLNDFEKIVSLKECFMDHIFLCGISCNAESNECVCVSFWLFSYSIHFTSLRLMHVYTSMSGAPPSSTQTLEMESTRHHLYVFINICSAGT